MKKIADLEVYDEVYGNYVVKFKKPVQKYVKGYKFELRIGDSSGEVMLKFWGPDDEAAVKKLYDSVSVDDVVHVRGEVAEYHDAKEVAVNDLDGIRVLSPVEYVKSDFVKESEKEIDEMYGQLSSFISSVKNHDLKKVLDVFFSDPEFVKKFKADPAAMYKHHAWIGGLLEHTLSVVRICEKSLELYPDLDRDLVIAGAVLHDIGKTREFTVTTSIKPTLESRLVGHVVMGVEMLHAKTEGMDMPEELKVKLKHIIESHHGQLEWGSPKTPAFPEAMLVHHADYLDAKLTHILSRKKEAKTDDDFMYLKEYGSIYLK
ncbi:MAG: HD domain-containing protein [Candidatus Altiarchaeota archaeon]